MKILVIIFCVTGIVTYVFFQNEERYIKRQTEKLIQKASFKTHQSDIALLRRVSEIAKKIHVRIQLKAEYEGKLYETNSLNEFRSLLFAYFKIRSKEILEYKNLTVKRGSGKNHFLVYFDFLFKRIEKQMICKALVEWIKEKKWYVKKIEVSSCILKTS